MLTALLTLANIYKSLIKKNLLSKITFGLSVIVLLMLSEDFNFSHIRNIDSKEKNQNELFRFVTIIQGGTANSR
jgi:hypothetical protein